MEKNQVYGRQMKWVVFLFVLLFAVAFALLETTQTAQAEPSVTSVASDPELSFVSSLPVDQRKVDFDDNWKFNFGDVANAEVNAFDDSSWGQVNVPHDYSLTQDYSKSGWPRVATSSAA